MRVLFLLFLLFLESSFAGQLRVLPDSTTYPIELRTIDGRELADLSALGLTPSAELHWSPLKQKLDIRFHAGSSLIFTAGSPWVGNGKKQISTGKVVYSKGRLWTSPSDLAQMIDSLSTYSARWKKKASLLEIFPRQDLLGIEIKNRQNGTLVEITTSRKLRHESFFTPPHYLFRFEGSLDTARWSEIRGQGLVKKLLPIKNEKTAQLTFRVSSATDKVELQESPDGRKIQLIFRKKSPTAKTANPKVRGSKHNRKIRTVIIDPGHGGHDPGASGQKSKEKEITLAVGKLLKKELEKRGFRARITRSDDRFVHLKDRPTLATQWDGDLFISLHCDAISGTVKRKKRIRGFKVYILREASSEEDKAIARRENKAIRFSGKKGKKTQLTPVEWILLEHQLNLYTRESERFAKFVVDGMSEGVIRKLGSGAGQAGFFVLVGAFMPAVLVEMGFISNPDDEHYLKSTKGQRAIANELADAVKDYGTTLQNF